MAWAVPFYRLKFGTTKHLAKLQAQYLSPVTSQCCGRRVVRFSTMAQLAVRDTVELTEQEQELFQTLLDAAKYTSSGTVLRVAGGWVRDKLLGKQSADIDIALDNMLGKDFAERVNEYLQSKNKRTCTTAVIQSNPDQSKHLETARMKINDTWIDLVNLRSETYAQGSRIPSMEFGTPEEDAMRRDFTINSMFYNINEGVVEDFTKQGLEDLRQGIIRTPLPPSITFMDDPLRVLRAVRFASRFDFQLHESIVGAASSHEVRSALGSKVSRERVGTELEGMFYGPAPIAAVRLLSQLQLFPEVFTLPPEVREQVAPQYGEPCVTCMEATLALLQAQAMQLEKEEQRMLLIAALLLPLRQLSYPLGKGKFAPVSGYVVREALKWRTKDVDAVAVLHEEAPVLLQLHQAMRDGALPPGASTSTSFSSVQEVTRVLLGQTIRKKLKQIWRLGMILAPITAHPAAHPLGPESSSSASDADADPAGALKQRMEVCSELMAAVEAFELADCWQWKSLLDGKQVMKALGLQKAGPQLGKVMDALGEWQLAHPHGTTEEAVAFIQQLQNAG